MAERADIISSLQKLRADKDALRRLPDDSWSAGTYQDGWNAREVLAHVAWTSGATGLVLAMASAGADARGAGDFDGEAFGREQIAMRVERTVSELLDEIGANIDRGIQVVEGVPDALLQKHFAAPWGVEGTVAEVIINAAREHLATHVADLRRAMAS